MKKARRYPKIRSIPFDMAGFSLRDRFCPVTDRVAEMYEAGYDIRYSYDGWDAYHKGKMIGAGNSGHDHRNTCLKSNFKAALECVTAHAESLLKGELDGSK